MLKVALAASSSDVVLCIERRMTDSISLSGRGMAGCELG